MYQNKKLLVDFLPEWLTVASKTKFNDDALISQLKAAFNHSIVVRLSFLPSTKVASDLTGYFDQVRTADATLLSLDPNYIIRSASINYTLSPPTTNQLTTSEDGDMMDLSVL
ncbi:hypothetical protein K3495_g14381 [Podosphaera aphanis]|nr:hypothetical protein K3495_g14381 [Podosphaera aphanis]